MTDLKLKDNLTKNPRSIYCSKKDKYNENEEKTALSLSSESVRVDGRLEITDVPAGEHNTNQFLVLDGDKVKTRTGAEVLSDIGDEGGDITQVSFTSAQDASSQIVTSGQADFITNGSNGVTTSMSAGPTFNITGINASTSAKGVVQLIDEDNMSTDSTTRVPTQQSVKAYVDSEITGLVDSAPGALDTLNELAAALGDDASFATTVTNSIATKLPLAGGTLTGDLTINAPASKLLLTGENTSGNHAIQSDANLYLDIDSDNDSSSNFFQFRAYATNLMRIQDDGRVGIGVTDPDSKVEIIGEGTSNSTKSLEIKDSGGTNLFYVRDDGVVSITHGYLFAQASSGAYFTGSIKARGGITDDGGALGLGSDGNTNHFIITSGNITTGVWNGTPIASAYLDADTAHLSGTQTFTGTKQFYNTFPQARFSDDSGNDYIDLGVSGNGFFQKTSDASIDFYWRDQDNNDLMHLDTSSQSLTIGEGNQSTYKLKIGDNGRMNMPVRGLEFENGHGYWNAIGEFGLTYILMSTQNDLLRHRTPLTLERWNGSAWVDEISGTTSENNSTNNLLGLKNILDGAKTTNWSLDDEWKKFRFVITREQAWAEEQLIYLDLGWSSTNFNNGSSASGSMCPTMTVEQLDGSFDASDDTNNDWTTNATITSDWHSTGIASQYGSFFTFSTATHMPETHVRITIEFPAWDASSGGNTRMNIRNLGMLSSYASDRTTEVFTTDWGRNAYGYGDVKIPNAHSYFINNVAVLGSTTLGSGVVNSSLTSVGTLTSLAVSGDATFDTSTLKVDSSNNRVGIGTTSPSVNLHVKDDSGSNTLETIRVENSNGYAELGAQSTYVRLLAGGNLTYAANNSASYFYIGGSVKMGLTSTGLGIGNTSPNHLLHVGDDATAVFGTAPDKAIQLSSTTNDHEIAYILYAGEGTNNIRSKYYVDDATKYVGWDSTHSTGWLGYEWKIAGSQSMTLDTSGNLELSGNLKASNLYSTENIYHTDDTHTRIQMLPDRFLIYAGNVEVLDYQEDGDSTLEIDNSGVADITFGGGNVFFGGSQGSSDAKVGIGTTSPTEPLEVWSANSQAYHYPIVARNPYNSQTNLDFGVGIKLQLDDGSEGKWASIAYEADSAYGNSGDLQFYVDGATNSTPRMTLLHEGKLGIGTTSPAEALDVAGNINLTGDILLASEKKIQFASADTKIYTNADSPEDLYIESDDDIYIRADDNLVIAEGTNNYVTFKGGERAVDITGDLFASSKIGIGTTSPTTTLDVEGSVSYKHISLTADSDDLDVSGCTVVECTPSGTERLGGLTGGVQGQILYILKVDSGLGRLIIEHNEGTGNQDIFLSGEADVVLFKRGGITLYCNGTSWFALDK